MKEGPNESGKVSKSRRYDCWDGDYFSFSELKDCHIPEEEWLVSGYIPSGSITGLVGRPGDGKSMLARMLAGAVLLRHESFLGLPLNTRTGKVIFFTAEDTPARTRSYFLHQIESMIEPNDKNGVGWEDNLTILFKNDHVPDEVLEKIRSTAIDEPDLIIIDNFGAIFPGKDPNNTSLVRSVLEEYGVLAERSRCAIVLIHHLRKAGYALRPDQEHTQGASGFNQVVRSLIDFRRDVYEPQTRYLTLIKGNYSPDEILYKARVHEFDPGKLIFNYCDLWIPAEEIPIKDGSPTFQSIPWNEIFGENKTLKRKEIVKVLKEDFEISRSTIDRFLSKLDKVEYGIYKLPESFSLSHSHLPPK